MGLKLGKCRFLRLYFVLPLSFFFFFHFLRASKLAYPLWNFFWSMVTSRNQCRQNVICLYIKTWLDWLDSIRSRTTWIEVAQVFMVVLMATRFLVFQWKPYLCHLTHLSTAERTERELLHRKVKTKLRHVTSWRWKFQFRNEIFILLKDDFTIYIRDEHTFSCGPSKILYFDF